MAKKIIGKWRITKMEQWDQDYVDMCGPGFIEFRKRGEGEFQFGTVNGTVDYRMVKYEGRDRAEFSWEGSDEDETCFGRGWAELKDDGLHGHLYFHEGDDSWFKAEK